MQYASPGEKIVVRFSRLLSLIGFAGLLVFAVATVLDVLMRWIFNSPITGVRDASSAYTTAIIASCFAICIVDRSNITIRFLGNALGRTWGEIFESFGNLVTLLIFGLTSWQLWLYAGQVAADGETTWVLGWPLAPWWYIASVLIGICVPVQGFVFWQTITSALQGSEEANRSTQNNLNS